MSSAPSSDVVKHLLSAGANPRARDKEGRTALFLLDQYAQDKSERIEIARLLKRASRKY